MEAAIVNVAISNIVVGTPRVGDSPIAITWDADWSGTSYPVPAFIIPTAKVSLSNGGLTTLEGAVNHATGSGSYNWTPNQVYSDVLIEVMDNQGGEPSSSTTFNVDTPILFDIGV